MRGLIDEASAGIKPLQQAFLSLQDGQQAANDAKPGCIAVGIPLDMFIEYDEEFFLKSIGGGVIVPLVTVEVTSNDIDEAIGERQDGVDDKGVYGLGKVLQGSVGTPLARSSGR